MRPADAGDPEWVAGLYDLTVSRGRLAALIGRSTDRWETQSLRELASGEEWEVPWVLYAGDWAELIERVDLGTIDGAATVYRTRSWVDGRTSTWDGGLVLHALGPGTSSHVRWNVSTIGDPVLGPFELAHAPLADRGGVLAWHSFPGAAGSSVPDMSDPPVLNLKTWSVGRERSRFDRVQGRGCPEGDEGRTAPVLTAFLASEQARMLEQECQGEPAVQLFLDVFGVLFGSRASPPGVDGRTPVLRRVATVRGARGLQVAASANHLVAAWVVPRRGGFDLHVARLDQLGVRQGPNHVVRLPDCAIADERRPVVAALDDTYAVALRQRATRSVPAGAWVALGTFDP